MFLGSIGLKTRAELPFPGYLKPNRDASDLQRGDVMVRFECDSCGNLKNASEEWILGFAAENVGLTAARRELAIAPAWDAARAREPLAVHFCSEECREDYVKRLFGELPNTLTGDPTKTKREMLRETPAGTTRTVVAEKKRPTIRKKAS